MRGWSRGVRYLATDATNQAGVSVRLVTEPYAHLLAPGRLGPIETRNRIVMAPMGANLAEADGHAGERLQRYFEERARGGAGLVIVDIAGVAFPAGASNPYQLGISSDEFVPGLRSLCERVHRHGAKIAVQLHHGSKVAVRDLVAGRPMWVPSVPDPKPMDLYDDLSPEDLEAATGEILRAGNLPRYHEMSVADIETARAWFADAAARAQEAGFDGVEVHAGHGYLVQSFLSPASNHRTDAYGGSREGRARFMVEVIRDVRARVGDGFGVWVRLDAREFGIDGGITEADGIANARFAAEAGADAVHVSAYADSGKGALFTVAPLPDDPGAYLGYAAAVKAAVDVPVIAVGRVEPEAGDAAIAAGEADFVAMGRKLLADPDLPRKLAAGERHRVRPCIYTYRCVGNIFLSKRAACAVNPHTGREFEHDPAVLPADTARRVLVVGGGPAGMETARLAALRGHAVTLVERGTRLGGRARLAAWADPAVLPLLDWLEGELARLDVDVRLGADVGLTDRAALGAFGDLDAVVDATGARAARLDAPGSTTARVLDLDALRERIDRQHGWELPARLAVVGAGGPALQIAARAARAGASVTLLSPAPWAGGALAPPKLWRLLAQVRGAGGRVEKQAAVRGIGDGTIAYAVPGEERAAPADLVVVADLDAPAAVDPDAIPEGIEVHRVGDAAGVRGYDGCFADAATVARAL